MANEKKNLEELKAHLEAGEEIESSVLGAYECKLMGKDTVRNGILAATNKKVIFYAKKMFGYDMEVFPYSNISSIDTSKDFMGHKISFFASGNKVSMKWINSKNIMEFIEIIKGRIGKKQESPINVSKQEVAATEKSSIDKIKELKELLDIGAITQEEFDNKKKHLLESI